MKKAAAVFFFLVVTAAVNLSYSQLWKAYSDSAKIYTARKMPDKAFENYLKAKEVMPPGTVFTDTLIPILKNLALVYYNMGELKQANAVCDEARMIISKVYDEMNTDYAWVCNMQGAIYNLWGKLDTAKAFHFKAKEIREKLLGDKDPFYAQSCNNLGSLYRDYGQFGEAEVLLLKAKDIREKIKTERGYAAYAITCTGLANLYRDMGQYEKAERFYLEAKAIRAMQGKDNADYAASCNILADLYSNSYLGQPEKAEALYLEAKDIRGKLDSESTDYGQTCNNLASLYRDGKQYEKAEALALTAKKIFQDQEDDATLTINLNSLGELNYSMGKYKEAESYFLTARQRWEKALGPDHPFFITNSEELAKLYWKTNETIKANELFSAVVQSKYKELNKIFRFTSEKEKQLYIRNIIGANDGYQSFSYKKIIRNSAGRSYDMSLLYRNLILSSTQELRQIIHNSRDTILTKTYAVWLTLKKQLANLYSQGAEVKPQLVKELEDQTDSIEKSLARNSSAFEKIQKKITWQNIREKLKNNEAAIEFVEFRLSDGDNSTDSVLYIALILKKTFAQPLLVPLFEKKQLDSLLEQSPGDETNTINKLYSSKALYNIIWKPVEKNLAGITKVFYAPSGNLFRISFGAIPLNNKEVLSDKYRLIQLNTTASVGSQTSNFITHTDNIRLYGGIDYDADTNAIKKASAGYDNASASRSLPEDLTRGSIFRYLPGTKAEVDEIKKQADKGGAKAAVLSGVNATKQSFLSLNDSSSPAILHIATHGFFFDDTDSLAAFRRKFETSGKIFRESANPLFRMGLLFAGGNNTWRGRQANSADNGIVTGYEVSTAMYLPNTKLVVLSACETARGHIEGSEGVYGLQRAFKIAGAQNLVMSLWKVPDAETSAFMQIFYRNMFNKQSVSDAFYNAQDSMKIKYRNEPYKWAAWVLVK